MARPLAARLRSTGLVVGGVALGVAVAVGLPKLTGDDPDPLAASRSADVDPRTLLDPTRLENVDGGRTRADSPRAAVEAFLTAEQEGDDERSFALLADEVRLEYGSAAEWAADPDAVPPVTGFEVTQAPGDARDRAVVETTMRYRSSLNAVAGLVPARAQTSWAVVEEEGGWAVDLFETVEIPVLPPEGDAAEAVRRWAQAQQDCPATPPSVVGQTSLARSLCGADGDVATGAPTPLSGLDAGALQTAFGGDATTWARVVDVSSPVALRAVVAPVDDVWTVAAVLPPSGQGR